VYVHAWVGAHGPGGYREQAGGSALLPTPPTQTPLTTYRHGNQGAQEGDAGVGGKGCKVWIRTRSSVTCVCVCARVNIVHPCVCQDARI